MLYNCGIMNYEESNDQPYAKLNPAIPWQARSIA
jgi:hypothetical protein